MSNPGDSFPLSKVPRPPSIVTAPEPPDFRPPPDGDDPAPPEPAPAGFHIPNLRWVIAGMLFLAAVLNYIDRNILGLLAPTIQKDLHLSDGQYASVVNLFLVAYTIAYLLSGRIVDKLGVRLSMVLFIAWWSVSNALTGFARSVTSLGCFRFMLGLGEAGSWTVSPKAVSEWFPARERGLAVGVYSIGGSVGATVAPLIVVGIAANYGWRWAFAVTPALAMVWLLGWWKLYRSPAHHTLLGARERAYLAANLEPAGPAVAKESEAQLWRRVLSDSRVWRLMLARLLTDPVWYFYQFWMPKYLYTARHVKQEELSIVWMIFVAADLGFLLGGFLSGRLIARGSTPPAARLWLMLASACLVPLSPFIPGFAAVWAVIALSMVVVYAHTSWLSNITSLVVDVVPKRILGTAFGVIACGSALGGIFMNKAVSWVVQQHTYDYCFYAMALVHPLALLLIWGLRRPRREAQPA